jgi:threonine synthase
LPVGNAGNITAYWIGYSEYANEATQSCTFCENKCRYECEKQTNVRPKMLGYQASGAAPFLRGEMVDNPETLATAIRIGHPQSWDLAWHASRESGGWFDEFSDEEILSVQKLLAEKEGIFCEPASAISLAGALRDIRSGKIEKQSCVTCTLTGHGLKDPDIAIQQGSSPVIKTDASLNNVKKAILDNIN